MTRKRLNYLAHHSRGLPGEYPILSIQRALDAAGVPKRYNATSRPTQLFARAIARAGLMRRIADLSDTAWLVPIMHLSEGRLFPQCYFAEMVVYIFDCWPGLYRRWERFFHRHRMKVAFFSARASADHFRGRIAGMESIWLPEAVEPASYHGNRPIEHRSIDVLELGRRWETYHDQITAPLAATKRVHRFQAQDGALFPTFEDLIAGLGNAKISICFPSSMTHPVRSGGVETVTHRYFESMASRCLIVGHCPAELLDHFGYNPVIEADLIDPAGQLENILREPKAHQGLIERNYQRLLEVGTWTARVDTLLQLLRERGYAPAESDLDVNSHPSKIVARDGETGEMGR